MKILATSLIILIGLTSMAQPDTEIYVFDLIKNGNDYTIENPVNITYENPGYDNQPHFRPDGELLYVFTKDGQTEIGQVELREYSWFQVSFTEGSEYSPTPMADGTGCSSIRLEKDGTQLLYKYPYDGSEPSVLVADVKIGYHCWYNENTIVAFVLGDPVSLQVCNVKENKCVTQQNSIGRSLHKIPNTDLISYVSKENDDWVIKSLHPITGATKEITNALPGSEDINWSPDGTIFSGKDSVLYKYNPKIDKAWVKVELVDKSLIKTDHEVLKGITRLAINPKGDKIAIVVNQPSGD